MSVHLTRIYTRTGDDGTTGLADFSRVPKTSARIAAYGDVNEANAFLGVALATGGVPADLATALRTAQNDMFDVGADLATPLDPDPKYPPLRLTQPYIDRLEGWCDEFNARLDKLDSFILPGGTPAAAALHVATTVTRRAERSGWALIEAEPELTSALPVTYLNRLSDLLFIASRIANPDGDVKWTPGGKKDSPR